MTTMITLRRRFAVAVAGVATAAATTVTLAPGSRTSKCRRCLWRNCLLRQRLVGPIVGLPNPGGCRSHRRQVVWLLRLQGAHQFHRLRRRRRQR